MGRHTMSSQTSIWTINEGVWDALIMLNRHTPEGLKVGKASGFRVCKTVMWACYTLSNKVVNCGGATNISI